MSWKTDPYWPKTKAEADAFRRAIEEADQMVLESAKRTQKRLDAETKAKASKSTGKKK